MPSARALAVVPDWINTPLRVFTTYVDLMGTSYHLTVPIVCAAGQFNSYKSIVYR